MTTLSDLPVLFVSALVNWVKRMWDASRAWELIQFVPDLAKELGDLLDELRIVPRIILAFWLWLSYESFNLLVNNLEIMESPALMAIAGVLTGTLGYCKFYIDGIRKSRGDKFDS
mgnify:CR=1 FL=1